MYEGLYQDLTPQMLRDYLQRIGLDAQEVQVDGPTKKTLDRLVFAHQSSVPFETLDTYGTGSDIPLETERIYDKLVTRRRGGYCFELNGLFDKLLRALGYQARSCLARAVIRRDYLPPSLHRVPLVELDGALYLADVGFGGPVPASALRLETGIQTDAVGESFSLELDDGKRRPNANAESGQIDRKTACNDLAGASQGWWMLYRLTPDGPQKLICFNTEPQLEVDFITPNYYCAHAPDSHFVVNRIVNLRLPSGSAQLFNDTFKLIKNGQVIEEKTVASTTERLALLREYFCIEGVS
jgi:N-hydroxyarylamine O-acetyltransferase